MYVYKSKLTNENFLKNAQNHTVAAYLNEINTSCDSFRGRPIPSLTFSKFRLFDETGDRAIYQQDYFERRRRLCMFLLRVWLFKEAEDIKELEDILWAVCDEYTWALPAHLPGILSDETMIPTRIDLFASETAHSVAEALSLCGEHLHPMVVRRCISEVFKRIIDPFETEERDKYGFRWEKGNNNWSAVCGGSVGMTALYLIEDKSRLKKITDRTKAACNCFFDSCKDDGVCLEGVSYWMYAMQYYVGFDELLKEVTGETIVENEEKMKNLAQFPSVACMANNIPVKFSDFGDSLLYFGILCKLHQRYGVSVPEKSYYDRLTDRCARTCGAVRTVAWFEPELLHNNPKTQDVFLPHAQWAILHRGPMTAVVKGGHNKEPHNHNDVGSYLYVKGDKIIADDLGSPKYTKAYFTNERYTFLNAGSHGHSLPIVNGARQQSGAEHGADKFEKTDRGIRISFADAYDKDSGLVELVRDLSLDQKGLCISDCFTFNKMGNSVTERIVTEFDAAMEGENKVSIVSDGKTVGTVEFFTRGKLNIVKDGYLALNASGRSDVYGSEDAVREVTIIELECVTDSDRMEIWYTVE